MASRSERIARMLARFPTLHDLRLYSYRESKRVDLVIESIRRSAEFATLTVEEMAGHYSMVVDARLWAAITVFVPAEKVAAAVQMAREFWAEENDESERREARYRGCD